MAQTYDLTRGKTTPLILRFFFPLLFTNMLQQAYTIADNIVVGKGLGDDALGAVGNMSSLTFFIIGFSATAYAEIGAWCSALIINAFAFAFFLSRLIKNEPELQTANND